MLVMSLLIGLLSVATSYYWWTIDWWRPPTLFGTKVGIEDFILGFVTGGVMATIYEVLFKRTFYKRKSHHHINDGLTILFLLGMVTSWVFYSLQLTSFLASTFAMTLAVIVILLVRRDLLWDSFLSGILTVIVSMLFYVSILVLSPEWIEVTYQSALSGIKLFLIPIEEYIFWFLAGMVFGPFYEYWQSQRLKIFKR